MKTQLLKIASGMGIALIAVGYLMTILHWYTPSYLLLVGFVLLVGSQFILFWRRKAKSLLGYARLLFVLFFSLSFIFYWLHLAYANTVYLLSSMSFLFVAVAFIRDRFFVNKPRSVWNAVSEIVYGIAFVGIVIGAVSKILHIKYGNLLLIVGVSAAIASQLLPNPENED